MRQASRSEREAGKVIERFHLAFVEVGAVRLPIADFVVKGGANMRFFFRSPRRSRDIDFNYLGHRFENFAGRVDEVLESRVRHNGRPLRREDIVDVLGTENAWNDMLRYVVETLEARW